MNLRPSHPRRRFLQAGAALAAAWACTPLRGADAPDAQSQTLDLDWHDSARNRPVPVRVYLPQQAGPRPLVVFSHGIGGSRRGYRWLGQHLADSGFVSLHLQHVGSDRQVWTGGSLFGVIGRLQDAAQEREAIARAQDLRFALDTLLQGELAPRVDATRIAAAGHSYGANTTLLASGARVQRAGAVVPLHDTRLRAAIVISAPPFYGEPDPAAILGGITLPTLHVTCTEDVIRIPGYTSGLDDRLAVFDATGSARKWLAVYQGGSHSMFTDRSGTGGALLNPRVKAATRELAVAFLYGVFDRDESALARWPAQHADILARFTPAA
jgi:dienelactone hydrolase